MKYLLLQYGNEAAMMRLAKDEPTSEATTIRAPEGKASVQNGPFAETREQLGGYYLIEVADLDAALAWAKRHPFTRYGAIEVRPLWS